MQSQHYSFGFDLHEEVPMEAPQVMPMLPTANQLHSALTTSSLGDSDQSSTGDVPVASTGSPSSLPQHGGISAIEVARLRAQEHAQKFKGKRVSVDSPRGACVQTGAVAKRRRPSSGKAEPVQVNAASHASDASGPRFSSMNPSTTGPTTEVVATEKIARDAEDAAPPSREDHDTKDDRYKRRLALNRESAAVSRVRRRAYIKELEERLAFVEAEKHQLVGKLDCMLSQNQAMSKQLSDMFHLVASLHQGQGGQQPL